MPVTVTLLIVYFIEVIFYLFHLSMLILMIVQRKKNFKGPFFNIFRIVLIADLVCYVDTVVTQKLVTFIPFFFNLLQNYSLFVTITFDILTYVSSLQFLAHLFLALNRFTLIWLPVRHQFIWRKQWYTVLLIIIPFLIMAWRIHEPLLYMSSPNGSYFAGFVNGYVTQIVYIITTVFYLLTTFLAGILNFLAFLKFLIHKKNNSTLNVKEKNLLFVSLVCFISQVLRASYNFGRIFDGSNPAITAVLTSLLPYLNDIFAWSGSISLMFLSASTRKAYASFYLCKSTSHINPTTSTTTKMFPVTIKI